MGCDRKIHGVIRGHRRRRNSQCAEYYSTTHYRKQVDDSRNIVDLVKNPNKFTAIIVGAIAVLILLVIFIILLIKKIVKKVNPAR